MAEIDRRLIRQDSQLLQRVPHIRGGALEQAAAAERKEGVGGKKELVVNEMVSRCDRLYGRAFRRH